MERGGPLSGRYFKGSKQWRMIIKRMIETSLIDWEGKIVTTLYVPFCNFRCPYCYNYDLVLNPDIFGEIPAETIECFLLERKDFIDGICISGGEPTLHPDLPVYLKEIKTKDFLIKLDTNGTNPEMLEQILSAELVDYIAMDIKSSLNLGDYSRASGIKDRRWLESIKESINLIMKSSVDYEFRTTVVPTLHSEDIIIEIARYISGARKYVLQKFLPSESTLEPSYQRIQPYSEEKMSELSIKAKKYVANCYYR